MANVVAAAERQRAQLQAERDALADKLEDLSIDKNDLDAGKRNGACRPTLRSTPMYLALTNVIVIPYGVLSSQRSRGTRT